MIREGSVEVVAKVMKLTSATEPAIAEATTAEVVRAQMQARGVTITDWADQRGFSRSTTYAVLAGRVRGIRGETYRVACALGIVSKPNPDDCLWLRQISPDEFGEKMVGE